VGPGDRPRITRYDQSTNSRLLEIAGTSVRRAYGSPLPMLCPVPPALPSGNPPLLAALGDIANARAGLRKTHVAHDSSAPLTTHQLGEGEGGLSAYQNTVLDINIEEWLDLIPEHTFATHLMPITQEVRRKWNGGERVDLCRQRLRHLVTLKSGLAVCFLALSELLVGPCLRPVRTCAHTLLSRETF
jgi:hypothetical protein